MVLDTLRGLLQSGKYTQAEPTTSTPTHEGMAHILI
jgi:hypothetical protein